MNYSNNIEEAKKLLNLAEAVLITSGAGMSVDSGLPDYRSNLGIIATLKNKGYNYNELLTPYTFINHPYFIWGWYASQYKLFYNAKPHEGYYLLKNYIDQNNLEYFIYTSNIDCMWKKAGFDKKRIYECHGSMDHMQSMTNKGPIWSVKPEDIFKIEYDPETYQCYPYTVPHSYYDGNIARPNVYLFDDEKYFNTTRLYQADVRFGNWYQKIALAKKRLVVIEIGAGTIIPTVREMSESVVNDHLIIGTINDPSYSKLIRINPSESQVPEGHISIPENGLKALKYLFSKK